MTYEWRLDAYRAWLWATAVLRERLTGEPAEENFQRWCEQQGVAA